MENFACRSILLVLSLIFVSISVNTIKLGAIQLLQSYNLPGVTVPVIIGLTRKEEINGSLFQCFANINIDDDPADCCILIYQTFVRS